MMKVLNIRGKSAQHHGVYLLTPDYPKYMKNEKTRYKKFPESEFDLGVYQANWKAGKDHCDLENQKTFQNRYLLIGRPQIGKTGVFLHVAYSLWKLSGKGPTQERTQVMEIEECAESDEEDERGTEATSKRPGLMTNMQAYPCYDALVKLKLGNATPSPRYGDPNVKAVRDWYLVEGMQYPYPDCLTKGNSLLKRNFVEKTVPDSKTKTSLHPIAPSNRPTEVQSTTGYKVTVYNQFCSKPLPPTTGVDSEESRFGSKDYKGYRFPNLGKLFIKKESAMGRWNLEDGRPARVSSSLTLPPIIIPSSGRAETALLDLSSTIPEDESYIQIVVIRDEEQSDYARVINPNSQIDVFVINEGHPRTIGSARFVAKKLGEMITKNSGMSFMFMMDDNISHWSGITLINDPCPLFDKEPNHQRSQLSDISLFHVLSHFRRNSFEGVEKFDLVGFSNFNHKSIRRKRTAFGHKHVYAAVLLNLERLKGIDYNQKAWAMEDTDFNLRTNLASGVIVKCMRYVVNKKVLKKGGVVPVDVPPHVQELMENNSAWSDKIVGPPKEKNVKKREGSEDLGKIRKRGKQGKGEGEASSTRELDLRRQLEDCQRKLQESELQQEAERKEKEKLIQERDMWKSKALAQGNKRALEKSSATGVSDSMMGGKKQRNK